jgi:hypothetical protein
MAVCVEVRIADDLSVPFISREDLLVAKLSAGRAQDLIDVDALRESDQSQEIEQKQSPVSTVKRENSRDPQDRSAERDQEAKPKDLSESPDKGLDDDLN